MPLTSRARATLALLVTSALAGCGARTGLIVQEDAGPPPAPECVQDSDCDGFADKCNPVACQGWKCATLLPLTCDDHDPCTIDSCTTETGACVHKPSTLDLDHDGHRGPLAGHEAGDPGACGDDCDDTSPKVYPGAPEICDGLDNDCNGIADDGAHYVPKTAGVDAVRVSGDIAPASPGGLAWSGTSYLAGYSGQIATKDSLFATRLDLDGTKLAAEQKFTSVPNDSYGGPVVWTGDRFGIAWSDRRDGNYEIYFAEVAPDGTRVGPDVRITNASGFSINPQLAWTGSEFVAIWQDDRGTAGGDFQIFAQRIDLDGNLVGQNLQLTKGSFSHESPWIAVGAHGIAAVWNYGTPSTHHITFARFDPKMQPSGKAVDVTESGVNGVFPTIVWNKTDYVLAWYDPDPSSAAVFGASYDEDGKVLVSPKQLTQSPHHSRYPALLPLGDRVELVWSDDKDQNQGYELYGKMLDKNLDEADPELRITNAPGDSVMAIAAFSSIGDLAVLFRDDRDGSPEVWFTHLVCEGTTQ